MKRVLLGASSRSLLKPAETPFEVGDLCLASPPPELRRADHPKDKLFLATVRSAKPKKVVTFFDDGGDTAYTVDRLVRLPLAEREAAKERYVAALAQVRRLASEDSEAIIAAAIESVKASMGGTLGDDGAISYTVAAGDEAREGRLFCEALLANFGPLAAESPAAAWMASQWREVCEAADADKSGSISPDEAVTIWDQVADTVSRTIAQKVDALGAPPRLYRGDLCLCRASSSEVEAASADGELHLATYVDATHATFFDGASKVSEVRDVQHCTPAARESAILRYTKAVAQCKAVARKPSLEVIRAAVSKVRDASGGNLGRDKTIAYTADAGERAEEGKLLLQALVANFAALRGQSHAVAEIERNWKVACAQADDDQSGTISVKEAVQIWDRIVIEMTRTFTSKLDKLGVNPMPLLMTKGDLCMVKPMPQDRSGHGDASKVYLATYVDETHAIYFDDADETVHEVEKMGPATAADRDVAVVKYTQALQQCMSLRETDADELVAEAIEEVRQEMGGTLGSDGKISYLASAGDEAREGQLLCEALVSNLGALWDESRSVLFLMREWRDTCVAADTDNSGTISEAEAAEIWDKVLGTFTKFVTTKLEALGTAKKRAPDALVA